ncbi:sensor histidine kinase [Asanoa sp. NPDC050611]|uniref:sensor histidine kinase n=1 Tax=Asanoa sp. NPDC050611 TaxID=3157098 RepID=UPI0033FE183F
MRSRPTRIDALLGTATFCLVAAAVITDGGPPGRAALAYAFAAGFAAVLLVARQWPAAGLLATAVGIVVYYWVDLPAIGLAAPAAAALYLAAERQRVVLAAAVGVGLLVVSVGARLIEGDDLPIVIGFELGSEAALMLAVIALGDAVRSRRSLNAELSRQAAEAITERRREAARQVEAERLRIAREVHDALGHTMAVISLQSAVAQEALDDGRPERAGTAIAAIASAGSAAMTDLRATLRILRQDGAREPTPSLDQLEALADRVTRSGLTVDLRVTGEFDKLPAIVGSTAYRVVQEALTNALRHAAASQARVTAETTGAWLIVEIADDGRGAPGGTRLGTEGHGLRGMSERVALLGGTFDVGDKATGGFRVYARLPLSVGTT